MLATCSKLIGEGGLYICEFSVEPRNDNGNSEPLKKAPFSSAALYIVAPEKPLHEFFRAAPPST